LPGCRGGLKKGEVNIEGIVKRRLLSFYFIALDGDPFDMKWTFDYIVKKKQAEVKDEQ
jgi:hypothetical protein